MTRWCSRKQLALQEAAGCRVMRTATAARAGLLGVSESRYSPAVDWDHGAGDVARGRRQPKAAVWPNSGGVP